MNRAFVFLIISIIISVPVAATDRVIQQVPEWHLKSPDPAYTIRAHIIPDSALIRATMEINYVNNSADTIDEMVFRLDLNAWQKDSYLDRRLMIAGDSSIHKMSEENRGYIHIDSLLALGVPVDSSGMIYDNTILHVRLPAALAPGQLVYLLCAFEAHLPTAKKSKDQYWQFDDWYPRVCILTDSGWIARQYMLWDDPPTALADYNVLLSIDPSYEIAFAGDLLNEKELFGFLPKPDQDSVFLDITNRFDSGIPGTQFTPQYNNGTKEYAVTSNDRHVFSFAVAPRFKRDRAYTGKTTIETFYHDWKKMMWVDSVATWTRDFIYQYQSKLGPFPYSRIAIVDADTSAPSQPDPQVIFLPGRMKREPLKAALAFYLASCWLNRPAADDNGISRFFGEGAAYYSAAVVTAGDFGAEGADMMVQYEDWMKGNSVMAEMYKHDLSLYNQYHPAPPISDSIIRNDIHQLHAYPPYVLRRIPSMLYMLRFALGDSSIWKALGSMTASAAQAPISPARFENVVDSVTNDSLLWFWTQFADTSNRYDFGVFSARSEKSGDQYNVSYRLINRGQIILPVEIAFVMEGSDTLFDTLSRSSFARSDSLYQFQVKLPRRPVAIVMDPHHYLFDSNRFDNYHFFMPIRYKYSDPPDLFIGFRKL